MVETVDDFIPTRGSLAWNTAVPYQEVAFKSHAKKSKTERKPIEHLTVGVEKEREELDMKKSRYEVIKFARSGVKTATKQKTDRHLAIELGARVAKKRKAIDYKLLLEKKQKSKERKKRKEDIKKLGQMNNGKSILKNKRKSSNNINKKDASSGLLDIYGTVKRSVGKYKKHK